MLSDHKPITRQMRVEWIHPAYRWRRLFSWSNATAQCLDLRPLANQMALELCHEASGVGTALAMMAASSSLVGSGNWL
jgi:hypothetical protein